MDKTQLLIAAPVCPTGLGRRLSRVIAFFHRSSVASRPNGRVVATPEIAADRHDVWLLV